MGIIPSPILIFRMMNVFVFILLATLLCLIYILWQQIKQQNQSKSKLDRSLDKQLLTILNGDRNYIPLKIIKTRS